MLIEPCGFIMCLFLERTMSIIRDAIVIEQFNDVKIVCLIYNFDIKRRANCLDVK